MKRKLLLSIIWIIALSLGVVAQKPFYIVYIGNSITQGALLEHPEDMAPPVQCSRYLSEQTDLNLKGSSNQGVSGYTTVDFLPAQERAFPEILKAVAAFNREEQSMLVFSVMLGTNDSAVKGPNGSPVSSVQYYTNLKVIIDELMQHYPKAIFILHRPTWYSPTTYNGAIYLKEGLERLKSYTPELEKLVSTYAKTYPDQVFMGDMDAFEYFENNYQTELFPENGNAGIFYLHPNVQGAKTLGEFWGKAIHRVLQNR